MPTTDTSQIADTSFQEVDSFCFSPVGSLSLGGFVSMLNSLSPANTPYQATPCVTGSNQSLGLHC